MKEKLNILKLNLLLLNKKILSIKIKNIISICINKIKYNYKKNPKRFITKFSLSFLSCFALIVIILISVFVFYPKVIRKEEITTLFTLTKTKEAEYGVLVYENNFIINSPIELQSDKIDKLFINIEPSINFTLNVDKKTITLIPEEDLQKDTIYKITLKEGLPLIENKVNSKDITWTFKTVPDFAITGITPRNGSNTAPSNTTIEIEFNYKNHNLEEFKNYFTLIPETSGRFEQHEKKIVFIPDDRLNISYTYKVIVKAGYGNDTDGILKQDYVSEFMVVRDTEASNIAFPYLSSSSQNKIETFYQNPSFSIDFNYLKGEINTYIYAANFKALEESYTNMSEFGNINKPSDENLQKILEKQTSTTNSNGYENIDLSNLKSGLYFIEIINSSFSQPIYFYIINSDKALFTVTEQEKIEGWLFNIKESKLIPNADIKIIKNNKTINLKTDENGLFKTEGTEYSIMAYVINDNEVLSAIRSTYDYNYSYERSESNKYKVFVYTDRPLYKAGDIVNYKLIVRNDNDSQYTIPQDLTLTMKFDNYSGYYTDSYYTDILKSPIYEEDLKVNSDFGTADSSFVIPSNIKSGSYLLSILNNDNYITSESITVAEYVKPKYSISIINNKFQYMLGETASVKASVTDYSGKPASFTDTDVNIYCTDFTGEPAWSENLDYFSEYSNYWWGNLVEERKVKTDVNGNLFIEIIGNLCPNENNTSTNIVSYGIEVNIKESIDYSTSSGTSIFFHKKPYNALAKIEEADDSYFKQGSTVKLKFKVIDTLNYTPITNLPVSISGNRYWYTLIQTGTVYNENTKTFEPKYETDPHYDNLDISQFTTDSNGEISIELNNLQWGNYSFNITSSFSTENNGPLRYFRLFTVEREETDIEIEESYQCEIYEDIKIQLDKELYNLGETATVSITSELDTEALVLFYRGNIYHSEKINLVKGQTIKISQKIEENYFPMFYVQIIYPSFSNLKELRDKGCKALSVNQTSADIVKDQKQLSINIISDKNEYQPGETAKLEIETKDFQKNPVESEVSIALVDKALLDLMYNRYQSEDMDFVFKFFTSAQQYIYIEQTHYNDYGAWGDTSGGAGEEGTRSEFPDIAYWKALVRTDQNGKATIEVKLPSSLTSWIIQTVGITKDTKAGYSQKEIKVSKDKFIDLRLPPFIRENDKMLVETNIYNYSQNRTTFSITAETEGLTLNKLSNDSITLNSNNYKTVSFEISPDLTMEIGTISITIKENDTVIDKIVKTIRIVKLGQIQAISFGKMLKDANQQDINFNIDDTSKTYITIYLSDLILNQNSLYSSNISTNSTIELSNSLIKNSTLYKYYDLISPTTSKEDLEKSINYALNIIKQNQAENGGLGWFDYDAVNTEITAFTAYSLAVTYDAGFNIGDDFKSNIIKYLKSQLENEEVTYDEKFLILYVLSLLKDDSGLSYSNYAVSQIDNFSDSPQALVYLTLALYEYNDLADGQLVLEKLKQLKLESERIVQWQDNDVPFRALKDDIFLTALVYDALVSYDDKTGLLDKTRTFLIENPIDIYSNSLSSVVTFKSLLINNLNTFSDSKTKFKIYVNEKLIKEDEVYKTQKEVTINSTDLKQGDNKIRIEKEGSFLYTQVYITTFKQEIKTEENEFNMTTKYINFSNNREQESFKKGDYVKVRVEVTVDRDGYYINLYDYIPAGFLPVQFQLEGVSVSTQQKWWTWTGEVLNKFGNVTSDYIEFNKYEFKKDETLVFEYLMQASIKGTYNTNGGESYIITSPDINGQTSNREIIIN